MFAKIIGYGNCSSMHSTMPSIYIQADGKTPSNFFSVAYCLRVFVAEY